MSHSQRNIIFGTGPIGMSVMDTLRARGYTQIVMVNRSGKTREPLPEGVELVRGDATDSSFSTQVTQGATVIYNALNPAYSKWATDFPPMQAGVVAAAQANQAKLVVMDNLYMYGDTNGKPIHEGLPYIAHTRKGRLRGEMAQQLLDLHTQGKINMVIARASDFVGLRVHGAAMSSSVFQAALLGKPAQVVGSLDVVHSMTYVKDVGRALVDLAEQDDTFGQVWHVPTAPAITTRAWLEKIYAEAGQPVKTLVAGRLMLGLIGLFVKDLGEIYEMLYEFEKPFIIDSTKFETRFGWKGTPIDEIIHRTLAWNRQNMPTTH